MTPFDRLYIKLGAAVLGFLLAWVMAWYCFYDPCEWCPTVFQELAK